MRAMSTGSSAIAGVLTRASGRSPRLSLSLPAFSLFLKMGATRVEWSFGSRDEMECEWSA